MRKQQINSESVEPTPQSVESIPHIVELDQQYVEMTPHLWNKFHKTMEFIPYCNTALHFCPIIMQHFCYTIQKSATLPWHQCNKSVAQRRNYANL